MEDLQHILDQLEVIEASIPEIAGCLDKIRIAIAGHSMGGHTASMLLGAHSSAACNGHGIAGELHGGNTPERP